MFGLLSVEFSNVFAEMIEKMKDIFSKFHWTDAVDIIILAFLFYFLLSFFRSRKAGALVVGIFLCIALYALATVFNLSGVRFIMSGVFQIGALAVIIIFQPELREILEAIGSGSLKGIKSFSENAHKKQAQFKAIDNVCKAVHIMSRERTGALIVIERTTKLDEITHTGITINADVSDYLIRNIFFDKAPLHDGAMVIEGNRIKAVACILPLPKHTYVDNELGTRHRAAVGLSEVSDALTIIVSEETGIISVAKENELKREFTEDSLRKFLVKELVREKKAPETN